MQAYKNSWLEKKHFNQYFFDDFLSADFWQKLGE